MYYDFPWAFTELIFHPLTSIHALHCVTQKGRKPNEKTKYCGRRRLRRGIACVAVGGFFRARGEISRTRARAHEGRKSRGASSPLGSFPSRAFHTGFVLFSALPIPWLFPWPFQVFQDLRFSCQFEKVLKTFLVFWVFFDLKQFNRHKLWCPKKCMLFAPAVRSLLSILHCPCLVICCN